MIFYILLILALVALFFSIRSEWLEAKATFIKHQNYPWMKESERKAWSPRELDFLTVFGFPTIVTGIIFGVVVGLLSFGAWGETASHGTHYKVGTENQNLAALDLGTAQEAHGSLFFLIGSYDSEGTKKLNYLADGTGDGGYTPQTMDGSDAIIYQGVATPHLTIETYNAIDNSHFWVPWDVVASNVATRNLFYVPEGSIQTKFDVDISK